MKISTKGRYALRMMCDIAANDNGSAIPLKEIAARQNISVKYLEQIVILLSRAGFVKSVRGAQGGYKLTNPPKYYTVGMILRLTEGSLAPVSCLEDNVNTCGRASECRTLFVWEQLYSAICNVVDNITIEDILMHSGNNRGDDYVI
ncbi:Rrf2 family transcriptional regulator [Porcipelethomonas sp.]|uniref:RrF2 family transcriptional regulator n=1 Tax=Porcipelethomonas sp. TaxID=2981675 RepID=UPI00307AAA27